MKYSTMTFEADAVHNLLDPAGAPLPPTAQDQFDAFLHGLASVMGMDRDRHFLETGEVSVDGIPAQIGFEDAIWPRAVLLRVEVAERAPTDWNRVTPALLLANWRQATRQFGWSDVTDAVIATIILPLDSLEDAEAVWVAIGEQAHAAVEAWRAL